MPSTTTTTTTPKDVVEQMAFAKKPRDDDNDTTNSNSRGASYHEPQAHPPAAPPPSPPYQARGGGGGRQKKNKQKGNTRAAASSNTTTSASETTPLTSSYQTIPSITSGSMADASIRPNIGLTNMYADYALFGLACHQLLQCIRVACIVNAVCCILLALLTWFWRVVTLRLDKAVLLMYLCVFSACLLLAEVWTLYPNLLPNWNAQLQRQMGLLFHPPGKVFFLYLLATLCWGIGSGKGVAVWEGLFGLVYFGCASCLLYAWCRYPDLRNAYADFNMKNPEDFRRSTDGSTRFASINSWSDYAWAGSTATATGFGERASLLYQGMRNEQQASF